MRNIHKPDKEGFIPSIFNYCDRWCERCEFVDRCRVGFEELDAEEGGFKQRTMDEAMKEVGENFKKTIAMLHDMAKQHGIDLNDALKDSPENREHERAFTEKKQKAREHPLSKTTMDYSVGLHKWLRKNGGVFKSSVEAMAEKARLGIDPEKQLHNAQQLSEALELLERYSLPVASKSDRAIMGRGDGVDEYEEELGGADQTDWNGSAKVAIMLVERSLAAWEIVFDLVPSVVDDLLPTVSKLKKAHARLEKEFPNAQKFVRPGFDAQGRK